MLAPVVCRGAWWAGPTLGQKTGPAARKARNARYGPLVGSLVFAVVGVLESGFAIAVGGGLVSAVVFVAVFWDRDSGDD